MCGMFIRIKMQTIHKTQKTRKHINRSKHTHSHKVMQMRNSQTNLSKYTHTHAHPHTDEHKHAKIYQNMLK